MKKLIYLLSICLFIVAITSVQSCSSKSGCEYNNTKVETKRNGDLKTKRGKSRLYPKKMTRG